MPENQTSPADPGQVLAGLRSQLAELERDRARTSAGRDPQVDPAVPSEAGLRSAHEVGRKSEDHASAIPGIGHGATTAADDDVADVEDDVEDDDADADADAEQVAHTIVLRQLTGQARTRAELARVMQRKNVPPGAAGRVLDRMEAVGLVDDAEFAQSWVESRQRRRHLSSTALRRELRAKGVATELTDQAVASVDAEGEYAAALELAERKHARMVGLGREVVRRRLSGVLARRGFGTGIIVGVLGEVLSDRTEPDDAP